ncbi:hypothetical protein [Nocardioides acrostichi]|uniref:Uncharacterized protein n=1 Tax=Nocardioides acrostichi TaxID=2784339 RepID=A0A930YCU9_9ACTN|nr:hypothetical protein [Nocardioides acrostichi]MBF4163883.1 hypothetical protein [Nocardioides acrostichi]
MSELSAASERRTPEGVVPYVEYYTGPCRTLTLDIDLGQISMLVSRNAAQRTNAPTVSIDGRNYPVYWGRVYFEIPATRAVHVAVSVGDSHQVASVLLPAGGDTALSYRAGATGASLVTSL